MTTSPRYILASGSPRRQQLLREIGLDFEIIVPRLEERRLRGEDAASMVSRLACEKGISIARSIEDRSDSWIIISADTTVVAPPRGQILEKPKDERDAGRMVRMLAGRTHAVYTGYCIISVLDGVVQRRVGRVVKSAVTMRPLTKKQIEDYVRLGESLDKAGAYAVQGAGRALIERISGSYTNVVGLPLSQLTADLEHLSGYRLFVG